MQAHTLPMCVTALSADEDETRTASWGAAPTVFSSVAGGSPGVDDLNNGLVEEQRVSVIVV